MHFCVNLVLLSSLLKLVASRPIAGGQWPAPRNDRLTLVTILDGAHTPSEQFFQSIEAQSAAVDLIVLSVGERSEACPSLDLPSNGLLLCISTESLHTRLAKALCGKGYGWSCSEEENQSVLQHVRAISKQTSSPVIFQPLLGMLLSEHVQTDYWAWLEVNTVLGDFATLFPFDILSQYSIITYASSTSQALHLGRTFTAFHTSTIRTSWRSIRRLASPDAFLRLDAERYVEDTFWNKELLWSPGPIAQLSWLIITRGLAKSDSADDLFVLDHGMLIQLPNESSVRREVLPLRRTPNMRQTFTSKGAVSKLDHHLTSRADECELPGSMLGLFRLCPFPMTRGDGYRIYYMRFEGKWLERREPIVVEDQVYRDNELLFLHTTRQLQSWKEKAVPRRPLLVVQQPQQF